METKNWKQGHLKRRTNLLYRLRKKGIRVDTKERTIFAEYGSDPLQVKQIVRLRKDYNFNIQFYFT